MTLKQSALVAPDTATRPQAAQQPHRATAWPAARTAAAEAGAAAHAAAGADQAGQAGLASHDGHDGHDGQAAQAGHAGQAARGPLAVPLGAALGRVLAGPLLALTDLPSFDTSAMDGWAVAGTGPWTVREEGAVLAGHAPAAVLADGEAVRIATGARVPTGTTAVIRSEHAEQSELSERAEHSARSESPEQAEYAPAAAGPFLHALREVRPGQDIRPRGQECRSGDELLPAGSVVTPAVLGLAAAAGYDALPVLARPRVEILVLGDELLTTGLPHEGLIRDALGPMLGPWLEALGAEVLATRRIGDDAEELYAAVTGSTADLLITTGGTAAGPVDHLHRVLDAAGATLLVDGVKVRPGHPMLLARLAGGAEPRHLVGLPGNPLAAVSGLLTLAEPLLAALAGAPREPHHTPGVPVQDEIQGHPHDTRLVPVVRRADQAVPLHYNGPAMLRGIAAADGLAVVPPGGARPGQALEILGLPWPTVAGDAPAQGACFT
ncbi:molybdopterin molybdotransferase MoeA [Streptomyces stackebrandtii]|uniref:molybdopterin molybdotransferase MoeA n=1 Tax=Streptomyces stackebrandtii TaxID=3051177 RepID=UPI0028DD17A6|nr:molybdopterin molybdotransferase MoeA [Streptomyces sp. DSM 40976]